MNSIDVNNTLTNMQNFTEQLEFERSKERYGSTTMDKHSFLRLLTEQLKHQDPLKPMDNFQFIQQQAAFTQIEELQNLTSAITSAQSLQQASSLIGKVVTLTNPDNPDESIKGTVTAAHIEKNGAAVEVNGVLYPIETISRIEPS